MQRGQAFHGASEHSRLRFICACVDDFGLHGGVNDAALRLAAMGRVHAIGCMVGGERWRGDWVQRLGHLDRAEVDVGLHLDFTEAPLLQGSRRSLRGLIAACLFRHLDTVAARAEIRAQLDSFEDSLGRAPAYVDGHQHVHQFAVIREQLLEELARRYGNGSLWLRSTRAAGHAGAKARVIERLGQRRLAAMARRAGLAQNHALLGVYDFRGGRDRYRTLLAGWLACASDADLLMCHAANQACKTDPLSDARQAEFDILAGSDFGELLDAAGVRLAPMSRLLARRQAPA